MIETAYVAIKSNGKFIEVNYFEDGNVVEGPATFPARYASFAAIIQYVNTSFNTHHLGMNQSVEIQGLLGSPWPHRELRFNWSSTPERQ